MSILYSTQSLQSKARLSGFLEVLINLSFLLPILDRCYLRVYPSFHCGHRRIRSRFSRRSQNFFREKVYLKCVLERKFSWFEYFREKFPNTLNPPTAFVPGSLCSDSHSTGAKRIQHIYYRSSEKRITPALP